MNISSGNNLAEFGLRIAGLSKKNQDIIPREVSNRFQEKHRYYESGQPLPDKEWAEAEKFLGKWENP